MLCQLELKQCADQFAGLTSALLDQAVQIDRVMTYKVQYICMCCGFH